MEFIDGKYEELLDGWVVSTWEHGKPQVDITGPTGQDATLDAEGLQVDVHPEERGRGWDGDCASARSIPFNVLEAAFRIFTAVASGKAP